jgi:hypothetical protein
LGRLSIAATWLRTSMSQIIRADSDGPPPWLLDEPAEAVAVGVAGTLWPPDGLGLPDGVAEAHPVSSTADATRRIGPRPRPYTQFPVRMRCVADRL